MNQRVNDLLQHQYGNYILPFFWQHGADEATLREYMEKIDGCGIKAVCLEARPHPDYVGPKWWQDVDIVMDEARKRGMKVWILDDSHFPTGFANGAVKDAPDHLKRWALLERTMEVNGPLTGWRCEVATRLGYTFMMGRMSEYQPEELVAVILGRYDEVDGKPVYSGFSDVTGSVKDGWLRMDIPEGDWTLFIYTKKQGTAAKGNDYISFLEKDSVKILLDTVYEPHYAHYKEDFGKTFAGFFSDEPGFYNLPGNNPFGMVKIGDPMPLPWSDGVGEEFYGRTAGGEKTALPALFHNCGGSEGEVRYDYMDIITRKYQENFSCQLGDWCAAHGVEYIGHVLEDNGLHSRLGPGTGHYFRAMRGQHMAGIDVVLNQLLPDKDKGIGAFYHYAIAQLAASAAHQNPWMKGRALCEIFGAFGWSEGLTMMKWMADHMMVNGINTFTPHAFTEKAFPDPDCPPHFYAHGMNPQYRYMHVLFEYMNRVCHLLNGGRAMADVAIFFPAEGEWAGGYRDYRELGKRLIQNQIPYELLCMDNLKAAKVKDGRICIGDASYQFLLVDHIEQLPEDYMAVLDSFAAQGAQILFVGNSPTGFAGTELPGIPVVEDEELLGMLDGCKVCRADSFQKWLRCYRYQHDDVTVYFFANSSMLHPLDCQVQIPAAPGYVLYHGIEDVWEAAEVDDGGRFSLHLDKGETLILLAGEPEQLPKAGQKPETGEGRTLTGSYRISLAPYTGQETFEPLCEAETLGDIGLLKPGFSGIVRYETTFDGKAAQLDLGTCYEAAEVWVNGKSAGVRIGYPYRYDIEGLTVPGTNTLRIEVATTLAGAQMDFLSMQRPVEPDGLMGPVTLY